MHLEGYEQVNQIGVSGSTQHGIDISARYRGVVHGIQCKHYARSPFGRREVNATVEAAVFPAERYILCLCVEDRNSAAAALPDERWELWDKRALSAKVRSLERERAIDLVRTFFSNHWLEAFLGERRVRTFMDADSFYAPYTAPNLVDHSIPLVGRPREIEAINGFLSGREQVCLVKGRMGVGKSKLISSTMRQMLDGSRKRFLANGAAVTEEALHELPSGPLVIVIDSLENCVSIDLLLAFAATHPDVKVVIGGRPALLPQLESQMTRFGLHPPSRLVIELEGLTKAECRQIVQGRSPLLHRDALNALVRASSGNPLALLALLRVYDAVDHVREETIRNVCSEILQHFGPAAYGELTPYHQNGPVLEIMRLFALLGPIAVDPIFIARCVEHTLLREEDVRGIIGVLETTVLTRQGRRFAFLPDILRAAIIRQAAFAGSSSTNFVEAAAQRFGFANVLRNCVEADQYFPAENSVDALLWPTINHIARSGTNYQRLELADWLEGLGSYRPDRILEIARIIMRSPRPDEIATAEIAGFDILTTHEEVLRKMSGVLAPVLLSQTHLPTAVDLLWTLSLNDTRPLNSTPGHPLRIIRDALTYRRGYPISYNIALISAIDRLSARPAAPEELRSPVQLLEPALALAGSESEESDDEHQYTYSQFAFHPSSLAAPRRLAIDAAIRIAMGADGRRADRALQVLQPVLSGVGPVSDPRSQEDVRVRIEEKGVVLGVFDTILADADLKLKHLRIAELLRWSLRFTPDTTTNRVRAMLDGMPADERSRLYKALAPDLRREYTGAHDVHTAWQAHRDAVDELIDEVARDIIRGVLETPLEAWENLRTAGREVESVGLSVDYTSLLSRIAQLDFGVALQLLRLAAADTGSALFFGMAGVLRQAWMEDIQVAQEIAASALASEAWNARLVAIHGTVFYEPSIDPQAQPMRLRILRNALVNDSHDVRRTAALYASSLLRDSPDELAGILAVLPFDDAGVVDNLLSYYHNNSEAILSANDDFVVTIVEKCGDLPELGYWVFHFFSHIIPRHLEIVVGTLIQRCLRPFQMSYDALPFGSMEPFGTALGRGGLVGRTIDLIVEAAMGLGQRNLSLRDFIALIYPLDSAAASERFLAWIGSIDSGASLCVLAELLERVDPAEMLDGSIVSAFFSRYVTLDEEDTVEITMSLQSALLTGTRSGAAGQPMPQDVALRDAAIDRLTEADQGSYLHLFWQQMLEESDRRINRID